MKFKDDYQVPYSAETMRPALSVVEQTKMLTEAFNNVAKQINEWLIPTIETLIEKIVPVVTQVTETILRKYPNKRVVHLALHGKPRVRKKNIKRITRYIEKLKR